MLGLVALRQAALLVSVDRHLVTTDEVQSTGGGFDLVRLVLLGIVVIVGVLAARWLRDTIPVVGELQRRGVVDGVPPRTRIQRLGLPWHAAGIPSERLGWAGVRVEDGRALVALTLLAIALAAGVGIAAAAGLGAASEASAARGWRLIVGLDGGLWLIAFVLLGASIDGARWRQAAAARALGLYLPLVDAPGRTVVRLLPPLLMFGAGVLAVSGRPDPWLVPCPQSSLACDGMLVPVDHDSGSNAAMWIAYGVHRAAGPPKGTLAIAVGGPGDSGIGAALSHIDAFDPRLVDGYDLLFWDQRGVGASGGKDCPRAGREYVTTPTTAADTATFVQACLAEAGVAPDDLARYSTHQAAEDLESIRDHLGLERFALYGESYGTELAQQYAASHPDRLTALILDGAVDRTRSANEFWADAARGFERALDDTFASCGADPACRADLPDPAEEYDRALRAFDDPVQVSYADPDGTVRPHAVDAAAIDSAISQLLYEPTGRSLVLRAVAAAERGDEVPLARLSDLLGSGEGPGASEFAYYAITCADYRVSPTADPHDFQAVEDYARRNGISALRTAGVFTSQYPCLSWPYQPATGDRPAPIASTPYPVFVLGAADDPITPVEGARAIASRLTDGYLVMSSGGPHVTFGRGDSCVDGPVLDYLLDGRRPATRSISCGGDVIDGYVELTPASRSDYRSGLDAMRAAQTEIYADPDATLWDGLDEIRVGCRDGGWFSLADQGANETITFTACAFVPDLPLTGLGSYDFATGGVHWSVTFPDGELTYDVTGSTTSVSGHWNGQAVNQSE